MRDRERCKLIAGRFESAARRAAMAALAVERGDLVRAEEYSRQALELIEAGRSEP